MIIVLKLRQAELLWWKLGGEGEVQPAQAGSWISGCVGQHFCRNQMMFCELWLSFLDGACDVKVTQLCLTLCDPMDYTVHGILHARILEWIAFPVSRGSSQPRDRIQVSHIAGRFFTRWATGWYRSSPLCNNHLSPPPTPLYWTPLGFWFYKSAFWLPTPLLLQEGIL